mmetsp:Transcript_1744/g.4738  ORF Transcript_1744/g.4738 Transcript_1744/m.4738 type:complete len:100 (-) Transcript_1744:466-765(-)
MHRNQKASNYRVQPMFQRRPVCRCGRVKRDSAPSTTWICTDGDDATSTLPPGPCPKNQGSEIQDDLAHGAPVCHAFHVHIFFHRTVGERDELPVGMCKL